MPKFLNSYILTAALAALLTVISAAIGLQMIQGIPVSPQLLAAFVTVFGWLNAQSHAANTARIAVLEAKMAQLPLR